jgi:hypothetical protein
VKTSQKRYHLRLLCDVSWWLQFCVCDFAATTCRICEWNCVGVTVWQTDLSFANGVLIANLCCWRPECKTSKLSKLIPALRLNLRCFRVILNVTKIVVLRCGSKLCCSMAPRLRLTAASVTLRLVWRLHFATPLSYCTVRYCPFWSVSMGSEGMFVVTKSAVG